MPHASLLVALLAWLAWAWAGCAEDAARAAHVADAAAAEPFVLPDYVAPAPEPEDNPATPEKVALGRLLFYEPRLSMNGAVSCASCHEQASAFAVAEARPLGAADEPTARNAQSLVNVAYASYLTWSNLTFLTLEQQMLTPLFGDNPVELGAGAVRGDDNHYSTARLEQLLAEDARVATAFDAAFANTAVTWQHAIDAIACFERTLLSFRAPYDGYLGGELDALDEAQARGRALFFSERLHCGDCHSGPLLSRAFPVDGTRPTRAEAFRNTGLYNLENGAVAYLSGDRTRYPSPNIGIAEFSQDTADDGKFRIPSLRNVALTAPYMHDGSIATLSEVLDHYARGGTATAQGPLRGDGYDHPAKDPLISGFTLHERDKRDLLAFLEALSDTDFIAEQSFAPIQ
jgi:cytochrome c peroxidase